MKRSILVTALLAFAGAASAQITFTDLGATPPTPGPIDISQLATDGDTAANNQGGINYYDNNNGATTTGAGASGQSFTTGANAGGYVMTNLVVEFGGHTFGGNDSGGPQGWRVQVFQLFDAAGGATYTNVQSLVFSNQTLGTYTGFGSADWMQFSGMAVQLNPSTKYAYTIVCIVNRGSSYDDLGYQTNQPYAGGAVCRIRDGSQAINTNVTYYPAATISAAFDVGLSLPNVFVANASATPNPCYALSP